MTRELRNDLSGRHELRGCHMMMVVMMMAHDVAADISGTRREGEGLMLVVVVVLLMLL